MLKKYMAPTGYPEIPNCRTVVFALHRQADAVRHAIHRFEIQRGEKLGEE